MQIDALGFNTEVHSLQVLLMGICVHQQILEYEDYKNDTESYYEEYEIYEDSYDFAEREGAQTWDGQVNCAAPRSHIHA